MLSVGILVQTPSDPRILSLPGGKEGRRGERREEGGKKGGGMKEGRRGERREEGGKKGGGGKEGRRGERREEGGKKGGGGKEGRRGERWEEGGKKGGGGKEGRRGEREKERDERTFQRSNPHAELQDKVHQVYSDLGQLILCLQQFS